MISHVELRDRRDLGPGRSQRRNLAGLASSSAGTTMEAAVTWMALESRTDTTRGQ